MTAAALALGLAVLAALSPTVRRRSNRADVRRRLALRPAARTRVDLFEAVGSVAWRLAFGRRGRRRAVAPPPAALRRVGVAALGLSVALVNPLLAAGVVLAALGPLAARERRAPGVARDEAVATLPDAVDLIAVAARAGLPAPAALAGVAERAPPPWGPSFRAVADRTRRGERFVDALDQLAGIGGDDDVGRPLRALLRSAVDDGGDLVGGLDRLAVDARDLRRRRAEAAARRIPVRLLLPLVACSLPAFALLTIVPIVAGALGALDP